MSKAEAVVGGILERAQEHVPLDDRVVLNGDKPWDPQVLDDEFCERLLGLGGLELGEAYVDGRIDVESVDGMVSRLLRADVRGHMRERSNLLHVMGNADARRLAARGLWARFENRQSARRATANARAHYDLGNDLYESMLDPRMVYSCAYWADADNLNDAQTAKLGLVADKLQLEDDMRILELGAGWGAFAEFVVGEYAKEKGLKNIRYVGITPAVNQASFARARTTGLPGVEIRQAEYRELDDKKFDRIVSIGMMEHVGPKNFPAFFAKNNELLKPDGLMLHHLITGNYDRHIGEPWIDRYIFPGGVIPSLEQVTAASKPQNAVEDMQNIGPDYARTLGAWYENFRANGADLHDERFQRMWTYYLLSCKAAFEVRHLQTHQIVLAPTTREEPYRRTV